MQNNFTEGPLKTAQTVRLPQTNWLQEIKGLKSRVGISGTTAKSRKRKFVLSSHTGPYAVVASSRKSQTKVGTLSCFDFL